MWRELGHSQRVGLLELHRVQLFPTVVLGRSVALGYPDEHELLHRNPRDEHACRTRQHRLNRRRMLASGRCCVHACQTGEAWMPVHGRPAWEPAREGSAGWVSARACAFLSEVSVCART